MLFSTLACFSPYVMQGIRKLWVKNGGTLTHTDADFHKARFFFCASMDDPWLNELLSRRLIVRHAAWIEACVAEQFLMPIAPYTLDDNFDQNKLPSIHILPLPKLLDSERLGDKPAFLNPKKGNSRLIQTKKAEVREQPPQKRRRSGDEESYTNVYLPPSKKARIDQNRHFPDSQQEIQTLLELKACSDSGIRPISLDISDKCRPLKLDLTGMCQGSKGFSKPFGQSFACLIRPSCCVKTKQVVRESSPPKPCNQFWENLRERHYNENGSHPWRLSIDELLGAPQPKTTILKLNNVYRGRKFIDLTPIEGQNANCNTVTSISRYVLYTNYPDEQRRLFDGCPKYCRTLDDVL